MSRCFFKLLFVIIFAASCGGGGDGDDVTDGNTTESPSPASSLLSTPQNNNACLDGENVSFVWSSSQNTDRYELHIKNLNSKIVNSYSTTETNTEVTLEVGIPYSWFVKSFSNSSTKTASSDTWKFYLVGDASSNYAPFPAEILLPSYGSEESSGSINLSWTGNDPDSGDILTYQVILDQNNPPTTVIKESTSETSITKVLSAGSYYWKVITLDDKGSNSDSGVSYFTVN